MARGTERFHTRRQYSLFGLVKFLEHIEGYFAGNRTIPVLKTTSQNGEGDVTLTFSDDLLRKFLADTNNLKKPYEVAIKYGFGGHSKGGQNGIFYQRASDTSMIEATDRLIQRHQSEIIQDLDVTKEGLDALQKVKIVCHNTSGERIVGAYNTNKNRMMFLDFASY